MKVESTNVQIKHEAPTCGKRVLPAVFPSEFDIKGWADENCESPKNSGQYLCLVKWYNQDEYHYSILDYDKKTRCWEVTDSCEHILWTNLPPSPFR